MKAVNHADVRRRRPKISGIKMRQAANCEDISTELGTRDLSLSTWMGRLAALSLFVATPSFGQEASCGDRDTPCEIDEGTYHIMVPEGEIKGTVVHLHGGGGRARGLLRTNLARLSLERGYAFIAPQGYHPGRRFAYNWSVRAAGTPFETDDIDLLRAVMADAVEKHGANDDNVLLAGFSRGGSMVWDVACHAPDFATAFAPAAGAFWDPMPEGCNGPVDLFHTHGWNDRTVPLEGRSLREGTVVQGDVWESLKILRANNGCEARQPAKNVIDDTGWWRFWSDCNAGSIDLWLFDGGHGVPRGWAPAVLDWFEAKTAEGA